MIDFRNMGNVINHIAWWTVPAVILTTFVALVFQGLRWYVLLKSFNSDLKLGPALSAHFIATFYSIVVPSNLSQDVIKTVLISRQYSYASSWGATWLTKVIGLAISISLSLVGFAFLDLGYFKRILPSIAICLLLLITLVVLSFSKHVTRHFRALFGKILPAKFLNILENIRQGIYLYKNKKNYILRCILLTFATQFIMVINGMLLLAGITGKFYILETIAFIPAIEIIAVSFIFTPNGLGIREMLAYGMFTYIGLSKEQLGIYIILSYITLLMKLVGLVPLFANKKKSVKTNSPTVSTDSNH